MVCGLPWSSGQTCFGGEEQSRSLRLSEYREGAIARIFTLDQSKSHEAGVLSSMMLR